VHAEDEALRLLGLGEGNIRPECCTDHLLTLVAFVDDLLTRHGIVHWLDYGTLLGAVRSGELIPWDADVDFGILERDVEAVLALRPEIEAAGHWLETDESPAVLRVALSKANRLHADLFVWAEEDGLLRHRVSSIWDWPGMQDRTAFPPAFVESMTDIELHGRALAAPSPHDDFLRLHRYGEDYLTPQRTTTTGRFHFLIDSAQATPLVEELFAEVVDREQRLLQAIRSRSVVSRMRLWEIESAPGWIWTALPMEPEPRYLAVELARIPAEERDGTAGELARALAWLAQAIDEYKRPPGGITVTRARRRGLRLAWTLKPRLARRLGRG